MPPVAIGPCVWMPAPGGEPSPAFITAIGKRTVNVTVFAADTRGGFIKDGVRHASDPDLTRTVASGEAGCWDFTADQKRVAHLESALGAGEPF
jgi:hypothetical protein